MIRVLRNAVIFTLFAFVAVSTFGPSAIAQKKKSKTVYKLEKSGDGENSKTVIIKDENGKVTVNGRELRDGEDIKDYLPEGMEIEIGDGGNEYVIWDDGPRKFRGFGNKLFLNKDDHDFEFDFDELEMDLEKLSVVPEMLYDGLASVPGAIEDGMYFFRNSDALTNPEIREMERKSRELAREIRKAEDGERRQLEEDLTELLSELFDAKQEHRVTQLDKMMEKVDEMKTQIDERNRSRADIIAKRKAELLGERDKLDW